MGTDSCSGQDSDFPIDRAAGGLYTAVAALAEPDSRVPIRIDSKNGGLALVGGYDLFETNADAYIIDQPGTAERFENGGGFFILVGEAPAVLRLGKRPLHRYPVYLPVRYQRKGLRVVFSADVVVCDDSANCLPATRLVEIRRIPCEQKRRKRGCQRA